MLILAERIFEGSSLKIFIDLCFISLMLDLYLLLQIEKSKVVCLFSCFWWVYLVCVYKNKYINFGTYFKKRFRIHWMFISCVICFYYLWICIWNIFIFALNIFGILKVESCILKRIHFFVHGLKNIVSSDCIRIFNSNLVIVFWKKNLFDIQIRHSSNKKRKCI